MWGKKWPWRRSLSLQSAWSRSLVTKLTQTTFQKPLCVAKDPSLKPLDITLADLVQKLSQSGGITSSREQTESHREWANQCRVLLLLDKSQNGVTSQLNLVPLSHFPASLAQPGTAEIARGYLNTKPYHTAVGSTGIFKPPDSANALCTTNIACAFSTCQDPEVTASLSNEVVLWASTGKGNRLFLHCLIHEIWVVCFFVWGLFFFFFF